MDENGVYQELAAPRQELPLRAEEERSATTV
jgi:hypothetical protein